MIPLLSRAAQAAAFALSRSCKPTPAGDAASRHGWGATSTALQRNYDTTAPAVPAALFACGFGLSCSTSFDGSVPALAFQVNGLLMSATLGGLAWVRLRSESPGA
jgi:hypothetical protein